ncbi:MAG: AgmX/PglI C-terminal domain-containing protein [Polyangiales bacterium]
MGTSSGPPDTFAVSGLRGTLSQQEIDGALRPKLRGMLGCIQQRRDDLEALAGGVTLAFHVATDGRVVSVHPSESSLGDRETERCIVGIAQATRFPPPHGGEADFSWPLEVDPDAEVRAPVALEPDRAATVVRSRAAALLADCGGGQFVVTMYVRPDGSVAAAGAAAPDGATDPQLDCVTAGLRAWTLASPGSYLGKLSVALP